MIIVIIPELVKNLFVHGAVFLSAMCADMLTGVSVNIGKERNDIYMENVISFICGTAEEFTPQVLVGLIIFCSMIECIGNIAYALTSVGKR